MEQVTTKVKKWGNSFGIILPKGLIAKERLDEGSEVTVTVQPKRPVTVGELLEWAKKHPIKLKKNTHEIIKEFDKELWGSDM